MFLSNLQLLCVEVRKKLLRVLFFLVVYIFLRLVVYHPPELELEVEQTLVNYYLGTY